MKKDKKKIDLDILLDEIDRTTAKKLFVKHMYERELFTKIPAFNKIIYMKFDELWNEIKAQNLKVSRTEFINYLEGKDDWTDFNKKK